MLVVAHATPIHTGEFLHLHELRLLQTRAALAAAALMMLALAGCAPGTKPMAPETRALESGVTQTTLTIAVTNDLHVRADMFTPASATAANPAPAVLVLPTYFAMIFGQSERFDREYALALTRLGYVTIVPVLNQYGARAYHPGHAADLVTISKWARERPEIVDDRIAAVGFSVGAYHAAVLGSYDPAARAVVGYYGPYDTARFAPRGEDKATAVTNYPEKMGAPVLLLSGDLDDETLFTQHTEVYNRGLKAAGKNVEMVVYPGAYHRFDRGTTDNSRSEIVGGHLYRLAPAARDDAWQRTQAMLQKYLR